MVDFRYPYGNPNEDEDKTEDTGPLEPAPVAPTVAPETTPLVIPDRTPQEQAETDKVSRETGFPASDVVGAEKPLRRNARESQITDGTADAPATRRFLSRPGNAAKAQKDVESLTFIERLSDQFKKGELLNELGRLGTQFRQNLDPSVKAEIDAIQEKINHIGEAGTDIISWITAGGEIAGQMWASFDTQTATRATGGALIGGSLGAAGGPLAPVTAAAGAAVGTGAGVASDVAAKSFAVEGGLAYIDLREDGVDHETAMYISQGVGFINGGLETVSFTIIGAPAAQAIKGLFKSSLKQITKTRAGREALKAFGKAYAANQAAEVTTEALQEVTNIAGEEIAKIFSGKEHASFDEMSSRVFEVVQKTAKSMVLFAGAGPGVTLAKDASLIRQAKKDKAAADKIVEVRRETELNKIDPVSQAEQIAEVLTNVQVRQVGIPAEKLQELDTTGEIIAELGVDAQMQGALTRGGDVVIPIEDFTRVVMTDGVYETFGSHVRYGEDSLTEFEALEVEQAQQAEQAGIEGERAEFTELILQEKALEKEKTTAFEEAQVRVDELRAANATDEEILAAFDRYEAIKSQLQEIDNRMLQIIKNQDAREATRRGVTVEVSSLGESGSQGTPDQVPGQIIVDADAPGGNITAEVSDGSLSIMGSAVDENLRGTGIGIAMYEALIEQADTMGLQFQSDFIVSEDAQVIYKALENKGYVVIKNPEARLNEQGALVVGDLTHLEQTDSGAKDWVFRVNGKPSEALRVELAEQEMGLKAIFTSANQAGFTQKQWLDYQQAQSDSRDKSIRRKKDRDLAAEQRQNTKEWKKEEAAVRDEVKSQVELEQVYAAFNGIGKDRLDRAAVLAIMEENNMSLSDLPKQRGRNIYAAGKEGSLDPDTYAQLYDYENAEEMLLDMATSMSFEEAIIKDTNEIMRQRHSDLQSRQEEIIAERRDLHEAGYDRVLSKELAALRKAQKQKRVSVKALRDAIKLELATTAVRDISPKKFMAAERRAGRAAGAAIKRGDFALAAEQKLKQLMNYYMAVEAFKIQDRVKKRTREMNKMLKFKKKGEKLPVLYQEALSELLDAVSLKPKLTEKSLAKLLEAMQKSTKPHIQQAVLDANEKINFRDMDLGQFDSLWEDAKNLQHEGLTQNKLRLSTAQRELDVEIAILREGVETNLPKINAKEERSKWEDAKRGGSLVLTYLFNADTITREIDGFKDNGPFHAATKGRYDQAMSQGYEPGSIGYLRREKKESQTLLKLFKSFTKKERAAFNKKEDIRGVTAKLSRHERIAVMLNVGNQDGIEALIESGQFTQEEIDAIILHGSKKEWDFVQAVWDYLETFWPEISAAESRRRNYAPRKVQAREVQTSHGVYRGGYYSLKYDNSESLLFNATSVEEMQEKARHGSFITQHTQRGHTEERVGSGGKKVMLDIFTLNNHVHQLIYDLEMGDAVTDIWKVIGDKDLKRSFTDTGQAHRHEWLELWVRDITTDQMFLNNWMEKSFRWLRSGFTIAKLGWNVGVGLLQPLGLLQSSVTLGHQNMLWAVKQVMTSAQTGENSIWNAPGRMSGFMATRSATWNKDISDAQRVLSASLLERVTPGESAQVIQDSFFWMIKTAQQLTDTITWLAAHKKGMQKFGNNDQAVKFADGVIRRSQASGVFGDRTNVERGTVHKGLQQTELIRNFSAFISYFAAKTNVAIERTKTTNFKSPVDGLRWSRDMIILYTMEALIAALIQNRWPDEDDEDANLGMGAGFWATAAFETLKAASAGVFLLRDVTSEISGFRGGGVLAGIFGDIGKVYKELKKEDIDRGLAKAVNNILGVLFKYPTSQPQKTFEAIRQAQEGEDIKAVDFIFGPKFDKDR